jgi:sodium-dependent dicarboxylate transporter 2/3/5
MSSAKQEMKVMRKESVGLVLGPLLFVITILAPIPSMATFAENNSMPSFAPQIALGTMLWMIVWWVAESVPLGITGLIAPILFTVSGVLNIREAVQSFADPIIWIFISGFILAASFQRWGLDRRIAYSLAILYRGSNPKFATFFVACLPVFLLTLTGSITASTTIVFPFLLAFMNVLKISTPSRNGETKSNYAEASFLSLGQAATAGAMLLLISTAPNLIAKSTVEKFVPGETISFPEWLVIGTPHAIIGLLVSWAVIFTFIKPEIKKLPATRDQFKTILKGMGPVKREEKVVLAILISAMFLWIVPSLLRSFPLETGDSFSAFANALASNVTEAIPALMIIVAVAVVRTGKNTPPLLNWDEMAKAVDWNIVMLFGGGLVLGLGMQASGLADWMSSGISASVGSEVTPWTIFAISALMGFAISYAASNTASAVIACPIAATLAIGAGINPIPPILAAALACSISSAIPSTTPPMAIVYSSKVVRISNMFKTGMASDLIRLVLLIFLGPFLIDLWL